jgi:hypothetical protein
MNKETNDTTREIETQRDESRSDKSAGHAARFRPPGQKRSISQETHGTNEMEKSRTGFVIYGIGLAARSQSRGPICPSQIDERRVNRKELER